MILCNAIAFSVYFHFLISSGSLDIEGLKSNFSFE